MSTPAAPVMPEPPPFKHGKAPPIKFLAAAISLILLFHAFTWWRVVHGLRPGVAVEVAGAALFAFGAFAQLYTLSARFVERTVPAAIRTFAWIWMGVWFMAFAVSVFLEPVRWILAFVPATAGAGPVVSAATLAGVIALAGWGYLSTRAPRIQRVRVEIAGLDPRLAGFRIAQLSDVHVGNTIDRAYIQRIVDACNALDADLVAVTGDLVDGTVDELRHHAAPLGELRARHGVFFCTGNHEYYSGAAEWIEHLTSLGWRVLRNERVRIEQGGAGFDLAGVDDLFGRMLPGHGIDLDRALAGRDPAVPVVLLSHQPVTVAFAERAGVALQLSGHTHGGQIFPFHWAVLTQQPHLAGLHRHGPTQLYVHRGTGHWGPPFRIGAPSEIAVLELHPA